MELLYGLLIPFLGTFLGSLCVFLIEKEINQNVSKALNGFASGVMIAASIWSLLIPSINESKGMEKLSFLPPLFGFLLGIFFLLFADNVIPHLHAKSKHQEGPKCSRKPTTMMIIAITLENIPEGMAVGIVFAGFLSGSTTITAMGALVLSIGIAIENFPEGAIVSLSLKNEGESTTRAFLGSTLSGLAEPIATGITIILSSFAIHLFPYLLSFASGAMLYVVIEELVPEMSEGKHSNIGIVFFALGFSLMMALNITIG